MGPGNIRHTDQMLIHIVGQGFGDAEPCFFVKCHRRGIAAGDMEQKAADMGLLQTVYKLTDKQGAKAAASKAGKNLHMVNTEGILGYRGGKTGAGNAVLVSRAGRPGRAAAGSGKEAGGRGPLGFGKAL